MKTIFLKTLTLRNFKGIPESTVQFAEKTDVFGANETGKSTHYTAFNWLLTGKDEFDRKDHEIKNTKRRELNQQGHEVEAILIVDGHEINLKRVYWEDWQKPKGSSQKVFKGHYTEYYYNNVPCSATEYQSRIDEIIPANLIKLLTNPYFFNSLNWDKQRSALLQIAGNISNNEIFNSITTPQNQFGNLIRAITSGNYRDIEDWRKEIIAKKNLLKKDIAEYPVRINEAMRNMPEEHDWSEIEEEIKIKENEIRTIDEIISNATLALSNKQHGITMKRNKLYLKQGELSNLRQRIRLEVERNRNSFDGDIEKIELELRSAKEKLELLKRKKADSITLKEGYLKMINEKELIIDQCRSEWIAINAEKFDFHEEQCTCPTCKQKLPVDDIATLKVQLEKNFNESVASRKRAKVDYSNLVKKEITQLQESIAALDREDCSTTIPEANIVTLTDKLQKLRAEQARKTIEPIEVIVDALMANNADALNLKDEIADLQKEIEEETRKLGTAEDHSSEKSRKFAIQQQLDELKKQLAIKETIEKTKHRIEQLQKEESETAQAIADLEQNEFEIETYRHAKMDILEKRVNGMFRYVKFHLFNTLVNGGIEETCICEYNGVPYTTLNTAAKLLAGLDVLETLSDYYGIHAPVFCDCRESVTWIPESKSQIISLYVSPEDKKLRIVNHGEISSDGNQHLNHFTKPVAADKKQGATLFS